MKTPTLSPIALAIDPTTLQALVAEIVRVTLAELDAARRAVPDDRLAFSEAEAARLLGLNTHQLRDERLRGRIAASSIVGRRVRYLADDLRSYLMQNRTTTKEVRG